MCGGGGSAYTQCLPASLVSAEESAVEQVAKEHDGPDVAKHARPMTPNRPSTEPELRTLDLKHDFVQYGFLYGESSDAPPF